MKDFLNNALHASDLLQGFVDIAIEQLENLSTEQRAELLHQVCVRGLDVQGPEEAGGLAILKHLLENEE